MTPERLVSSKSIFSGRVVNLRIDTFEGPGGSQTTREIVEHADCVAIVPIDREGNVLLVRQYRHAPRRELLEIPAGGIEPGEEAVAAVRRELAEETGFSPATVQRLGGFYSSPGFCTEYLHCFLATDLEPDRLEAEDTAEIEVVRVRPEALEQLIESGTICDSKSIAGIYLYLQQQKRKTG